VVVQVPGVDELAHPGVHRVDAGPPRHRSLVPGRQLAREQVEDLEPVPPPHLWVLLQPALPVGPPEHLLHELLGCSERVLVEDRADHLLLRQEAVTQVRGQPGDVAPRGAEAEVEVAVAGVGPAGAGDEVVERVEAGGSGGDGHRPIMRLAVWRRLTTTASPCSAALACGLVRNFSDHP
jgi:hypothetical protein